MTSYTLTQLGFKFKKKDKSWTLNIFEDCCFILHNVDEIGKEYVEARRAPKYEIDGVMYCLYDCTVEKFIKFEKMVGNIFTAGKQYGLRAARDAVEHVI